MKVKLLRRALAVLLSVQPVFWMSNIALAQSLNAGGPATTTTSLPMPSLPGETEVVRAGQSVINQSSGPAIPLEESLDADKYICGRGDTFELNFWGVQNFKLRVTVDVEGRAFVTKAGYLDLQGKSLTQARRLLRNQVGKYFPRLSFDVTLVELRTFLVHVV